MALNLPLGVDPVQLARLQEVTKDIRAVIEVDMKSGELNMRLHSDSPLAAQHIPQLIEQLANSLGQQLSTFFAIKGELVRRGVKRE